MSKADEIINLCNVHIDVGTRESQTAICRKIEMSETEKQIRELAQYEYKQQEEKEEGEHFYWLWRHLLS